MDGSSICIAELGSGPGHLAKEVLDHCPQVVRYTAIDFSPAMHDLAKTHLGKHESAVNFAIRDFKSCDWAADLRHVDVMLTLQAAHEVRHKTRLPRLLMQMHSALTVGGILLFCDHYAQVGSAKNPELFPEYQEQKPLLAAAGFVEIRELLNEGGMALIQCRKAARASG